VPAAAFTGAQKDDFYLFDVLRPGEAARS